MCHTLPSQTPPRSAWRWIGRHLSLYSALWKNSIIREMNFKANFILWIFVEMLWFALQLVFFAVIYQHTDQIATWSKWQVVLLVGASHFIQQIFTAIFLSNITQLSENIRTGKLDFVLLLPVNSRFLISFRQVDLGGFVNAASALFVMAYAANRLNLHPSALDLGIFAALILCGIVVHYSLMLALSCTSFWTVRSQGIVWGYYNLFHLARMPDAAFHGFFKVFFTFAIPMLLVSNVPVKLLTRPFESPSEIVLLVGMTGLCFLFSEFVWRLSLRRYTSASS